MKVGTMVWLALLGVGLLLLVNARDIERYLRLRAM